MPMISIDDLDFSIHARARVRNDVVGEYAARMEAGDEFPAVVVFRERRRRTLWLADGQHRVKAARSLNRTEIEAEVRRGDRRAALLYACGANLDHGLRRTNADKRRAVELMLADEESRNLSDREIAQRCAVNHGLVGDVRRSMEADGRLEESSSEARTDKNGRTMNASGITGSNKRRVRQPVSKRNETHYDPDYARQMEVDALTRAWDAASPAARGEFVAWLREHHAGSLARPRDRSGLNQPRPQA
jgi:ParB-like chromosome segregation protein Spo0J